MSHSFADASSNHDLVGEILAAVTIVKVVNLLIRLKNLASVQLEQRCTMRRRGYLFMATEFVGWRSTAERKAGSEVEVSARSWSYLRVPRNAKHLIHFGGFSVSREQGP